MGLLPESSRLRTSASLVVILLIGICFLGFTYWTNLNHSQSYQRKISFLESTISKMAAAEDEADGREADLQKAMKKQKEWMQHMINMANQEIIKLRQKCSQEQNTWTQDIEARNAAIQEKEDIIGNLNQKYLKMKEDMAVFQMNQSQLLEKFTAQSEKMEMLVRLKDKCYSQMNSISKSISVPSLSSEVAAAGGSSKIQDKGSKEDHSEVKADVNVTSPPAANSSVSPSLYRALVQLPQPADKLKNVSSDDVMRRDSDSETPKNIASVDTVVNRDDNPDVLKSNKKEETKEDGKPMDEEVNKVVEQKQPTLPRNDEPDVLKPYDKEEEKKKQEPIDEEANKAVEQKKPAQPLNDEPNVLKPYDKEEEKKKQEPIDEEANKAVEQKKPAQPLNDEPDVLKPNDKGEKKEQEPMEEEVNEAVEENKLDELPANEPDIVTSKEAKKEDKSKDGKATAAVKEKQPVKKQEDKPDLLQTNEKEEAKNEEEDF